MAGGLTPSEEDGTVNERLHNVDPSKHFMTHIHTDGLTLVEETETISQR